MRMQQTSVFVSLTYLQAKRVGSATDLLLGRRQRMDLPLVVRDPLANAGELHNWEFSTV